MAQQLTSSHHLLLLSQQLQAQCSKAACLLSSHPPSLLHCGLIRCFASSPAAATNAAPAEASSSSVDAGSVTSTSSSSSPQQQQQGQQQQPPPQLYAACVLERLPILKSPPPAWEAEYKAWHQLQQLTLNKVKQYPKLDTKQQQQRGGDANTAKDEAEAAASAAASSSTAADASGAVDTMKRRLHDKLVLLVKSKHNALSNNNTAAAADGKPSKKQPASSSSWTFPHTAHQPGESMRQAAERALRETIGQSQVYFVGNAPMAHLDLASGPSSSISASDSTTSHQQLQDADGVATPPHTRVFFHLAQVVNDPWDVQLAAEGGEFAWVAKEELADMITDADLVQLAQRML